MNQELLMRLAEESGITQYVAANNKFLEQFAELVIEECVDAVAWCDDNTKLMPSEPYGTIMNEIWARFEE